MFGYLPALRTLRRFVLQVYRLSDPKRTPHQAWCRRAAFVKTPEYLANPHLAEALAMLSPDKFAKMIANLHSPAAKRVRTNNHVERTNRRLRYFEKVRYKWRRRRTIIRFIVLAVDRWRRRRTPGNTTKSRPNKATQKPKPSKRAP